MTILIMVVGGLSILLIIISYIISHKNTYPITYSSVNNINESKSQYECGFELFEEEIGKDSRERFYIKFYIIGILFLIFDLETILLLPASLLFFNPNDMFIYKTYFIIILFIIILLLGLIYEFRKNVL